MEPQICGEKRPVREWTGQGGMLSDDYDDDDNVTFIESL